MSVCLCSHPLVDTVRSLRVHICLVVCVLTLLCLVMTEPLVELETQGQSATEHALGYVLQLRDDYPSVRVIHSWTDVQ